MDLLSRQRSLSFGGNLIDDRSFEIECPPFDVQLSHWDRLFPPSPSKRILCFRLPSNADRQQIIECLHTSMHHIVQRFPPLAGSIVPFSPEEKNRPWLRNVIPQGAARLDVKDLSSEYNFSDLAKSDFSQHLLKTDELCPLPKVAYVQEEPVPVCRVQANFIDGGLLLVFCIIHIVADGKGVTDIINMFASNFRKAASGELGYPHKPRQDVYYSDRTKLVNGNSLLGAIENHPAWTSSTTNAHAQIFDAETNCHTFRINSAALSKLKEIASSGSTGPDDWISTGDAIAGLIWRSIMVARHRAGILSGNETTVLSQPVDCRALLNLPQPYFGNALYMTKGKIPLAMLADPEKGLSLAARKIRADIKEVTADQFRDLVGYVERVELETHTRLSIIEDLPTGGIILTNHFKFPMHTLDFGPLLGDGHVEAYRMPAKGFMSGAALVLPGLKDGSCEFVLTEQENTIKCLLEDELFVRFTKDENKTPVPVNSVISAVPSGSEAVKVAA